MASPYGLFGGMAPRIRERISPLLREDYPAPSPGQGSALASAATTLAPTIPQPAPPPPPPPMGLIGSSVPKARKQQTPVDMVLGYDPNKSDLGLWDYFTAGNSARRESRDRVEVQRRLNEAFDTLNLSPQDRARAQMDPEGFFRGLNEIQTAQMKPQTDSFYDPRTKSWQRKPLGPMAVADGTDVFDPESGKTLYTNEKSSQGEDIRQVGNSIVQRQPDGSWRPVYTGSTPAETARAFQGFIDQATGEQMLVMSDGTVKGTGRNAYVPPQITSVGGVPTAVDKRTLDTSQLAPLDTVAGNRAALASAEVQGRAQGQAAFDLPGIELRSETAINSISDLKGRNIGTRFGVQGKLYAIPGSEGADVQALVQQVTSQAFLNAFDQLRGAGAITQTEGEAATAAITRLKDRNISVGEALKAMDELQTYYRKGVQVARQKAVKAPVLPQSPVAGQPQAPAGSAATTPAMQMGIRAYSKQTGLPADAITEFLANSPTPEEIAEFNDAFGAGQAEAILRAMQGGR